MRRRDLLAAGLTLATAPGLVLAARRRVLRLHHTHTEESLAVTYRQGSRYHTWGLRRLDHFLRDFRTGEVKAMDPHLFDILWEIQQEAGHHDGRFEVISGYRSPKTNAALRRRSKGVARHSQHLLGKAVDVRLRGTTTRHLRDCALKLAEGGVGYYPRSDFVHLDTGRVRHW